MAVTLLKLKCRGKQINNKREVEQSYLSFFLFLYNLGDWGY